MSNLKRFTVDMPEDVYDRLTATLIALQRWRDAGYRELHHWPKTRRESITRAVEVMCDEIDGSMHSIAAVDRLHGWSEHVKAPVGDERLRQGRPPRRPAETGMGESV